MFQPANRSDFNRGLAIGHQAVAKRRPVQGATMVLLLGLFGLSVFSVKMAVRNDRAAEQAQVSADAANLSEVALEALLSEEAGAEGVIDANDAESRRGYSSANAAVDTAIEALDRMDAIDGVDDLRALHTGYGLAVAEMIERFAGGSLAEAEVSRKQLLTRTSTRSSTH